jgi:chemotaxis protein methyltransferase CheR
MPEHPAETAMKGSLDRLLIKVREERGLDLAQYRPRYVERRLAVRLNALGLHTYRQYAGYLDRNPDEYATLLDTLTINVTQFFRDPTVYAVFRDTVIPSLIEAKTSRRQHLLRVWSAGCATGEEPYSLAMSLLDGIRRSRAEGVIPSVTGTDIDRNALAVAKRGEYPIGALPHIPTMDRHRYVDIDGDVFRMKPEVTRAVRFQYLNLFEDPPIHAVDVVFCRNVFIYFNHDEQERMIRSFWDGLSSGGYLVLGRSERLSPHFARQFQMIDANERVYRKPVALR